MRPVCPLYMTSFPCFWKPILCRVLLTLATVTSVKGVASPSVPVRTPTCNSTHKHTHTQVELGLELELEVELGVGLVHYSPFETHNPQPTPWLPTALS